METVVVSRRVTWEEVYHRLAVAPAGRLYGVPVGGAIVAGLTGRAVDKIADAQWIVHELVDQGSAPMLNGAEVSKPSWSLFDRERDGIGDAKVIFPWSAPEESTVHARMERIGQELLSTLGYDPTSEHLKETPGRWARWWLDFHSADAGRTEATFQVSTSSQVVTVSDIRVWSICEHHLLPFVADVAIVYVPVGKVLGLSKFARIARRCAQRLQVQERLAEDIADGVAAHTGSLDVAVLLRGRHMCMEARGVKVPATTEVLVMRGAFRHDPGLRSDIRHLAGGAPLRSALWPDDVANEGSRSRRHLRGRVASKPSTASQNGEWEP